MENRILILALRGRDGSVISQLLERHQHECLRCSSVEELAREISRGAGAALVTEESLSGAVCDPLYEWLEQQEPWSDFPFILLATKRAGTRPKEAMETLERLGNVVVLERPIHSETLESAVRAVLRGRRRQYEARSHLEELKVAEERLTHLNAGLENRIAKRTSELSNANNRLMQEVSERERAQAALVQAQKMDAVGQLTGGIAHDFNNLLTVVSGNLELIERRTADERLVRYAGHARNATDRAAKLTHQLLAFSRTQQLELAPVDLNGLVEGMNDLLNRTIGPQVQKRWAFSPDTPWVLADAHQLELALLNLAINARDAMPDGGDLTIETDIGPHHGGELPSGDFAVVRVRDNGVGIPAKYMEKVFDPFFTTKPVGKGTGLGLSQVFGIAQQSGGTAQIESREGEGTTVSIWLPLVEMPAAKSTEDVQPARDTLKNKEHILVVDDDEGVRSVIVESLEMMGYTVSEAPNGAAGLALLAKAEPDALLLDFAMDGMNGAELADRARLLAPELPIILATGYADTDKFPACDVVLRKPFQIDALAEAVRSALKRGAVPHPA